eukprot:ANDGO_03209.mRNA.1 hypothetical protein
MSIASTSVTGSGISMVKVGSSSSSSLSSSSSMTSPPAYEQRKQDAQRLMVGVLQDLSLLELWARQVPGSPYLNLQKARYLVETFAEQTKLGIRKFKRPTADQEREYLIYRVAQLERMVHDLRYEGSQQFGTHHHQQHQPAEARRASNGNQGMKNPQQRLMMASRGNLSVPARETVSSLSSTRKLRTEGGTRLGHSNPSWQGSNSNHSSNHNNDHGTRDWDLQMEANFLSATTLQPPGVALPKNPSTPHPSRLHDPLPTESPVLQHPQRNANAQTAATAPQSTTTSATSFVSPNRSGPRNLGSMQQEDDYQSHGHATRNLTFNPARPKMLYAKNTTPRILSNGSGSSSKKLGSMRNSKFAQFLQHQRWLLHDSTRKTYQSQQHHGEAAVAAAVLGQRQVGDLLQGPQSQTHKNHRDRQGLSTAETPDAIPGSETSADSSTSADIQDDGGEFESGLDQYSASRTPRALYIREPGKNSDEEDSDDVDEEHYPEYYDDMDDFDDVIPEISDDLDSLDEWKSHSDKQ